MIKYGRSITMGDVFESVTPESVLKSERDSARATLAEAERLLEKANELLTFYNETDFVNEVQNFLIAGKDI